MPPEIFIIPIIAALAIALIMLLRERRDRAAAPEPEWNINLTTEIENHSGELPRRLRVTAELADEPRRTDPPELAGTIVVGIDEEQALEFRRADAGRYEARLDLSIAGTAEVSVHVKGSETVVTQSVLIPPGPIVDLDLAPMEFAFPQRETPAVLTVAAVDESGAAAGESLSKFAIVSDLTSELRYNSDHEAEIRFQSDRPGRFPVKIVEQTSGQVVESELQFSLAGIRPSPDLPLTIAPEDQAQVLTVPIAYHSPPGWNPGSVQLQLTADAGMKRLAKFRGARTTEESNLYISGSGVRSVNDGQTIDLQLQQMAPAVEGTTRVLVDFELGPEPGDGKDVKGRFNVTGLHFEKAHPLVKEPEVTISEDVVTGGSYMCSSKTIHQGCVIYVRTTPSSDKAPLSDQAICDAHNQLNETFRSACIQFDKKIVDVTITGRPVQRDLNTNGRVRAAMHHLRQALEDRGIGSCGNQKCLVVAIINHDVKGNGVSMTSPSDPTDAPIDGMTLIECGRFGTSRTLAHEIGHHLDGRETGSHKRDRDNLMTPTSGRKGRGTELTEEQINRMRQSGWLKQKTVKIYYQIRPF